MTPEAITYHRLLADRIAVTVQDQLREKYPGLASDLKSEAFIDFSAGLIVRRFESFVLGMPRHKIEVHKAWPADWWQALRERWAPGWWLLRHPVQYERIDIDEQVYGNICPHIAVTARHPHYEFLLDKESPCCLEQSCTHSSWSPTEAMFATAQATPASASARKRGA